MGTKTRIKTIFAIILCSLLICMAVFRSYQAHLLKGPCVPLEYPSRMQTLDNKIFEINEPLETVMDFYNHELDVLFFWDENVESDGRWYLINLSKNEFLYECNGDGSNNNDMSVAIGCVYITDNDVSVKIETFFYISGAGTPCPQR